MGITGKVYYDKVSGNVIITIPEIVNHFGNRQTSFDEDYKNIIELKQRVKESIGVIELSEGQYAQDFAECNGYRVNPETKTLEFSYPDPNEPGVEQPYQAPLSERVKQVEDAINFLLLGGI